MDPQQLLIPILVTLTVGGVVYAFVFPMLSGESKADKRRAALQTRSPTQVANRVNDAAKRKKQIAESLKELDSRTKSKKLTLDARLTQAGVTWTKSGFQMVSAGIGVFLGLAAWVFGAGLLVVIGLVIVGGMGLPRWFLSHLRKRRIKKFLAELPGAVDIIVRGIKAGIPLGDCLRNIANDAPEPVKTEFRLIVEAQAMGLTIADAVERIVDRVPTPEANFFAIVINIQQKAGGNLAEALNNLSSVLRDRKKMRSKVKAMSSEAKASAGIIGALPPTVAGLVYLTSPDYIKLLFITPTGHIVLGACFFWMGCGVFVMKQMINFDM